MAMADLTFCFRLKHRSQARLFFCCVCVCGLDCEELGLRLARAGFGSDRREFSRQSVCMLDLLQGDTGGKRSESDMRCCFGGEIWG